MFKCIRRLFVKIFCIGCVERVQHASHSTITVEKSPDTTIFLPAITAALVTPELVTASVPPRSDAGFESLQTAVQQHNQNNPLGALKYYEKAANEGLNELHMSRVYAEMAIIELMELGDVEKALRYWMKALSSPRVFYETAHTACQYLVIVYSIGGTKTEVNLLLILLSKTESHINYNLSPDSTARIEQKLKSFKWRRT